MPYRALLRELMDKKIVSGCIIFTPSGDIWWHTGTFPRLNESSFIDGYYLLGEWVTYPSSVRVAGVKYLSFVNSYPDYWILINTQGYGSLILQMAVKNNYYFLCWLDDSQEPFDIQKEIKNMTDLFG
ncbi:MAG: hypothetical protein ACFE9L_07415 [Candidatus Hodarchaeota archaeon]